MSVRALNGLILMPRVVQEVRIPPTSHHLGSARPAEASGSKAALLPCLRAGRNSARFENCVFEPKWLRLEPKWERFVPKWLWHGTAPNFDSKCTSKLCRIFKLAFWASFEPKWQRLESKWEHLKPKWLWHGTGPNFDSKCSTKLCRIFKFALWESSAPKWSHKEKFTAC